MQLTINGRGENLNNDMSISDLIKFKGVKTPEMVTVELNGDILDQAVFGKTYLKHNDTVELLYFMGGGNHR